MKTIGIMAVSIGMFAFAFWVFLFLTEKNVPQNSTIGVASAVAHLDRFVFDEKATVMNLDVSRFENSGPDGISEVIRLEDNSESYGTIFQDYLLPPSDKGEHQVSLFLKGESTKRAQLILHFHGRNPQTYFAYVDFPAGKIGGFEGKAEIADVGNGWFKLDLAGANQLKNSHVRVQLYPRHGIAENTGVLVITRPFLR